MNTTTTKKTQQQKKQWQLTNQKTNTPKAPVTNANAEWRKKPDIPVEMEKDRSEDRDVDEEGAGQEETADETFGDSYEQSGDQRQQTPSKKKSIHNQSKQSGTGIRYSNATPHPPHPPSGYLWLKQSLDDSTPLDGNIFLSRCGSRFYPPFFFIIISINNYITVASKMASPKTSKKGRQHVVFFFFE